MLNTCVSCRYWTRENETRGTCARLIAVDVDNMTPDEAGIDSTYYNFTFYTGDQFGCSLYRKTSTNRP